MAVGDGVAAAAAMNFGTDSVWAADDTEGYVIGRIIDIGAEVLSVAVHTHSGQRSQVLSVNYDSVFPAEKDAKRDFDDNCAMMYLNEATLLNNVRLRFKRSQIYTYVANILVAVNPYADIADRYSTEAISNYQGKSLGTLPPHIFAIADRAYWEMKRSRESQSVIVSGESGAGKTESQKHILSFLCRSHGDDAGDIQRRILDTNPILEAFGNAKTLRNNNSSRFGKFVQMHFCRDGRVVGGHVSTYLLEKSRVCRQAVGERNYHIFYQLCAGADNALMRQLSLHSPDKFRYLRYGCTQYFCSDGAVINPERCSPQHRSQGALHDSVVNDVSDFKRLDTALAGVGMEADERTAVYSVVAALLHLGNVNFSDNPDDNRGGCAVSIEGETALSTAARLLGLDADCLRTGLTSRVMQATKGGVKGTLIRVPLKPHEASHARDALTKAIYSRLFDAIASRINSCLPCASSVFYIGVLDIAGFEFFAVNSFEQFCINYCNEKLQHFFNDRILKQEQELYEKEGLKVLKIDYTDNQDCIDLIERRGVGLFDLLDEESKLPRPNPQHFTAAVHSQHGKHFRLNVPRKSRLKEHREIRDDDGFIVRHYAGAVCYQTALFLEKNNDALHESLAVLLLDSSDKFLRSLFADTDLMGGSKGKLAFRSVGSKFRRQLIALLAKLESTGTHFVRCIKPNNEMIAGKFEGALILSQLKCSGMKSVLELMQRGFPSRTLFSELYNMYEQFMPPHLKRLHPRLFCKCLFRALGLNDQDFKFGLTKVFFKPGKFAEFDQMMRADPENLKQLITKVSSWLVRMRWKKAQWGTLSVIKLRKKIEYRCHHLTIIQAGARGWAVRKKYRPMILEIRVKKRQDEERRQREKQEAEERARQAEIERKERLEMEERRKAEEKQFQEQQLQAAEQRLLQEQQLAERRMKTEQEKADFELASRLAKELSGHVDIPTAPITTSIETQTEMEPAKYDLTKWKYADLRDVINTSTAIDLLEACRREFHRRLAAYHAWRRRNTPQEDAENNAAVHLPDSVTEAAAHSPIAASCEQSGAPVQRYFKVPFSRAADRYRGNAGGEAAKEGLWYAHYDGQYVARQLEIHPNKDPLLLVAGQHDLDMCELLLDETGLNRKKGAEILEGEFEAVWRQSGGKPYRDVLFRH